MLKKNKKNKKIKTRIKHWFDKEIIIRKNNFSYLKLKFNLNIKKNKLNKIKHFFQHS
jgi:hypothetical protein